MTDTVVGSGQSASNLVLNSGDTASAVDGGVLSATTVNSGGIETLSGRGPGGYSRAYGTIVNAGGSDLVYDAQSIRAVIMAGGSQTVGLSGIAFQIVLSGGTQTLTGGSVDMDVTVDSGGLLQAGSTANDIVSTTVNSGGELSLQPSAAARSCKVAAFSWSCRVGSP